MLNILFIPLTALKSFFCAAEPLRGYSFTRSAHGNLNYFYYCFKIQTPGIKVKPTFGRE